MAQSSDDFDQILADTLQCKWLNFNSSEKYFATYSGWKITIYPKKKTLDYRGSKKNKLSLNFKSLTGHVHTQYAQGPDDDINFNFSDLDRLQLEKIFKNSYIPVQRRLFYPSDAKSDKFHKVLKNIKTAKDSFPIWSRDISTEIEKHYKWNILICAEHILNLFKP